MLGKREVFGTDHQRHKKIAQNGRDRWNEEEKDHDHAMHGEELVIGIGLDKIAVGSQQFKTNEQGKNPPMKKKKVMQIK